MRSIPLENRHPYEITETFVANVFDEGAFNQDDETYGIDLVTVRSGAKIFADPDAWVGVLWKSEEIVSFFLEMTRCYTSRTRFQAVANKL